MTKIGILREGKIPHDRRVAFTPAQCRYILNQYPGVNILVQPSPFRCYKDEEYLEQGINLSEDLSSCDLLIGIKEVPITELIPGKKYMFFSHTIKKQPYNKGLLQAILKNNIQLIDYECLTDNEFNRILGFGHYAGIVGAYNGIRGYGLKYRLFDLKPAYKCHDRQELKKELEKVKLPNIKIVVTGNGRVANGAIELLGMLELRRITPYEFVHYAFREATYAQLHSHNYNETKDGSNWDLKEFYTHPEKFRSTFGKYTRHCDLIIHCSFWDPRAPILFTKDEMKSPDFRISVIADVTCDINGSIPSTVKPSTIEDPFYGYDPMHDHVVGPFEPNSITVMAVDNLPCELPRDSSEDFGKDLIDKVIPSCLSKDEDGLIDRASITKDGNLNGRFSYLQDYVD